MYYFAQKCCWSLMLQWIVLNFKCISNTDSINYTLQHKFSKLHNPKSRNNNIFFPTLYHSHFVHVNNIPHVNSELMKNHNNYNKAHVSSGSPGGGHYINNGAMFIAAIQKTNG